MQHNRILQSLVVTTSLLTVMNVSANDVKIVDKADYKAVGNVAWYNQVDKNPQELINRPVADNLTNLIFIRRQDADVKESSANIAINDRFQVSLHPNGYTQVYSCAGNNLISVDLTGVKTNDLSSRLKTFNLAGGGTYFFYVDVDDTTKQPNVLKITAASAQSMLGSKKYQSHQVSRVTPNCPKAQEKPAVTQPAPIAPKTPTLTREVTIELEVLFDTDKHFIKPQFEHKVAEMADFMNKYDNTTAVIEGHTDSRAPTEYNQKLSQRRADAVALMLINKFGINPNRLDPVGYGELRPKAPNDTKDNLQLNRRTIAVIKEKVVIDENGNRIVD